MQLDVCGIPSVKSVVRSSNESQRVVVDLPIQGDESLVDLSCWDQMRSIANNTRNALRTFTTDKLNKRNQPRIGHGCHRVRQQKLAMTDAGLVPENDGTSSTEAHPIQVETFSVMVDMGDQRFLLMVKPVETEPDPGRHDCDESQLR